MSPWLKRAAVVGPVIATAVVLALVLRPTPSICDDLDRLGPETAGGFESIRDELIDDPNGEWSTDFRVVDASSCSVFLDPEQALYLCEWAYPLGDDQAKSQHTTLSEQIAGCAGTATTQQIDAQVNHPDLWSSTYFDTEHGQVSVSLKDKNALGETFVTVGLAARQFLLRP